MSNFVKYLEICKLVVKDEIEYKNFKRHPDYFDMLEHVNVDTGVEIYNYLLKNDFEILKELEKFSSKDTVGNPRFLLNINNLIVSPTTLRYIKVLSDIRKNIKVNFKNIIEIGVGYGGQAKVLLDHYEKIDNYDCVDLEETHELIKKYMFDYTEKINLYSQFNIPAENYWDICISNFAFSELPKEIQDIYFNKIILKSKSGYFTMNNISHLHGVESYSKEEFLNNLTKNNFNYKILDEYPKSHNLNYVVIFNKNE